MEPELLPGKEEKNPDKGDTHNNKKQRYWKVARIVALLGIIEVISLVLWIKSEDFEQSQASMLRWLAVCGFLSGGAYLAHKLIFGKRRKIKIASIWIVWASTCFALLFLKSHQAKNPAKVASTYVTNEAWLPPELPPDCSNIFFGFGNQMFVYSRDFAELAADDDDPAKIQIKDAPEFLLTNIEKVPNYNRRQRYMWVKLCSMQTILNGKNVNYPVAACVVSNRLFVSVYIPHSKERKKLVMSDKFDSELNQLPPLWDRNYSAKDNIYEIVNDYTNPVLQVIYVRPNEVHVNGIFMIDTNTAWESFGAEPEVKTMTGYKFVNTKTLQEMTNILDFLSTNEINHILTNALFDWPVPNQRAIFKYPSTRNQGVFADWIPKPQKNIATKHKQ